MRADMSRVLITRPRYKSLGCTDKNPDSIKSRRMSKSHDVEFLDSLPRRQKMKPGNFGPYAARKELNDYLSPLIRFLNANIGRNWDKVYAEIREGISPNSTIQMHILQHVEDFVHKNVTVEYGRVYLTHAHSYQPIRLYHTGWTFYVNPSTNILCRPRDRRP